VSIANLPKLLQPALKALERDLLARAKASGVEAGLRRAWEDEQKAGHTGLGFDPWRRERVTQLAAAWVLSVVFVRTLEDRGSIDPRVAGATLEALRAAEDRETVFTQIAPALGPREYLLTVFRELSRLPGAREVFDARHNPVWVLSPSSEGARALLDFFRKRDANGQPALVFGGSDTRFLGDLYQDLSEAVRKRYALLQTPEFVEEFILEQTLDPAIEAFRLEHVTLIDPTCGSGHFLLGAFRRLLGRWQAHAPTEPVAELARRALEQVYGVDINPYAVAIARFRLVLAVLDAVGIQRLERAPDIRPNVVVADSLLHRFDQGHLGLDQRLDAESQAQWGDRLFSLEDRHEVKRVLTKRYHAVVGNPPYITEKDGAKKKAYRDKYIAATFEVPLAPAFVERFFQLSQLGGSVGAIISNAFTKRDSGKALIEVVLPKHDIHKVIDTSGCYLPGHGTPTLLIFGRNRQPAPDSVVVSVLGKRGEQEVPAEPSVAPVWSEIVRHHNSIGWDGPHVSVEVTTRQQMEAHPWTLAGGGARDFVAHMGTRTTIRLSDVAAVMGAGAVTRADDVFVLARRWLDMPSATLTPYVTGSHVRDWEIVTHLRIAFPYEGNHTLEPSLIGEFYRLAWHHRTFLWLRRGKGFKTKLEQGGQFYEYSMFYSDRLAAPYRVVYPFVSTHNHFALMRTRNICNRHAPLIILRTYFIEADHQALLGYLNSSTVGFWCRLVMFPKGIVQAGETVTIRSAPWISYLEYAGNLLQQLPVPKLDDLRAKLLDLVKAAEATVAEIAQHAAEKVVARVLGSTHGAGASPTEPPTPAPLLPPTLAGLRQARAESLTERARLRGILVSLQEEMDWRVYGLFGLPTLEAPSVDAVRVPVEPNHRPFEVRLAREVATDISASEWFRVHKREAPADVGGPLAALYRERLRLLDHPEHGKPLRLLEAPETKRRWSPPDDHKAFLDAVRTWLLERIEAMFREQTSPELCTVRQLALELQREPAVLAAHELLIEDSGLELTRLLSELIDRESVPFLAGYRYAETGMEKRKSWEETWRLQRLEDQDKNWLAAELTRLGLGSIPVPDKYGPKDFQRHFWSLRGKLDVPKERFVSVPGGNADEDSTLLVGWAGWNHLQIADALASLYQRRKGGDGWPPARLLPLLAGIAERVPWLLQWHNDLDPNFDQPHGDAYRIFVAEEALRLGVPVDFTQATDALRAYTPPAAAKRTALDPAEVLQALAAWTPEPTQDDDEDDETTDTEPPEGPTEAELASDIGAPRALVAKALKKLVADGLAEKLSGRPARYVAIGDSA
jgi:hypothetical protein